MKVEQDKPLLAVLPESIASKFFRPLRGITNFLLKFFPGLKEDIKLLNFSYQADDYLAWGILSYGFLAMVLAAALFQLFTKRGIAVPRAVVVAGAVWALCVLIFVFLSTKHPHSVATNRAKEVDKYLLYALRDLGLQINSGETIFRAMCAVALSGYGEVSREFDYVVRRMNAGFPMEDVLRERVKRVKSEYLRKAYWQIINSIHSGSNLRSGIASIVQELNNDQKTKIQNYARELNLWSLVYMLFAVAIPTIGSTMLVILSTFANFGVTPGMFILFIIVCFFIQTALIVFVKSRRPVVQF